MLTETIKELENFKAKVQALEDKIVAERPSELADLPARYGFKSINEFIKAVKAAVASAPKKGKRGRKAGKVAAAKAAPKAAKKEKKAGRTRARITDEVKAKVKELIEAGKSGSEIAKSLGISLPSVQNIKKAFGLVKARAEVVEAVQAPTPVAPAS